MGQVNTAFKTCLFIYGPPKLHPALPAAASRHMYPWCTGPGAYTHYALGLELMRVPLATRPQRWDALHNGGRRCTAPRTQAAHALHPGRHTPLALGMLETRLQQMGTPSHRVRLHTHQSLGLQPSTNQCPEAPVLGCQRQSILPLSLHSPKTYVPPVRTWLHRPPSSHTMTSTGHGQT